MQKLVDGVYKLQKYPAKGGWTFVIIEGIPASLRGRSGMVSVNGKIDEFDLKSHNLFPMKGKPSTYFMAIKSDIRKKIKKEAGDEVHICLYGDKAITDVASEFKLCLDENAEAKKSFDKRTKAEREEIISWISSAGSDEVKVERMAKVLDLLEAGRKFGVKSSSASKA